MISTATGSAGASAPAGVTIERAAAPGAALPAADVPLKTDQREPGLAIVAPAEAPASRRAGPAPPADEITLRSLWSTFRRGLWLLAATALAVVVLTAIWLKLGEPTYDASMVVAPADRDRAAASRLAVELEQYASLATLAQTPARLEQVSTIDRYLQLMGSVRLAERLEAEHQVMRRVFQDQWDEAAQTWRPPSGPLARLKGGVLAFFGYPDWAPPTARHLADWLGEQIVVGRYAGTALRELRLSHEDGAFAAELLTAVHAISDEMLRQDALARAQSQVASLEEQLARVTEPARRAALEEALHEQYEVEALLQDDQPYAAEILSPATAAPLPSAPGPLLLLALALVVGLILGTFVVFLREALARG